MPQAQPEDFDVVLGGYKQPDPSAAVLGGLAGEEVKLAHQLRSLHQHPDSPAWQLPAPIDSHRERERLQQIANGLGNRSIECKFVEPSPYLLNQLTDRGRNDLDRDWQSIVTDRVVKNFLWDKTGRIAIKTAVVLNVYEKTSYRAKDRDICLAAIAPGRRGDEQIIRIELIDLYAINQDHNWSNYQWLWTDIETPISEWLGTNKHPQTAENDRAMRSLSLLDKGKIEAALGLYGVEVSTEIHQLIGSQRITLPYYSVPVEVTDIDFVIDTMRQLAPWKLPQAVIDKSERLALWVSKKKSRRPRLPSVKLAIFPHQRWQSKTCLFLTSNIDGSNPHIIIMDTGSNERLHHTAWKRSIAVDFNRYGIEF